MKNTFKINSIAITIEGNPVELNGIEFTNEASVQELATSGGLIKSLVAELKPLIEEATKPAPQVPMPQIQNTHNNHNYNRKNEKPKFVKPDAPESVELRTNKLMLDKPASIENTGFHKWEYCDKENNNKVTFELSITETLDISIKGNGTMVWIHVYGSNTKISGLDFESLPLFLDQAGFPADVKAFIMKAIEI